MELPVSMRTRDRAPGGAHQIEATTEQLRVGGVPLLTLDKGKIADADRPNGLVPKLTERFRGTSMSTVALRLQANVPYETLALILNTARAAGVPNAAIQVREVGASPKTGWLNLDGYVMSERAADLPPITAVKALGWEAFTSKWQAVFDACRGSKNGNCAYVETNFAEGGTLKIELFASGRGVNVDFYRRGLTDEQWAEEDEKRKKMLATKKEDFLQGRISHDEMVDILLLGDPATQALFQFRYQEALLAPSSLSETMAPICHAQRCPVVVAADKITPMVTVISMLGAAFPDGTPSPAYAVEMPWTPRKLWIPEWAKEKDPSLEASL
jgi:hypothetical protein